MGELTDSVVKAVDKPATGNLIRYDLRVKGFGIRVTAAGARAFILNYRTRSGRERRYTIGSFPDWTTAAARDEAKRLKQRVDRGEDPQADKEHDRTAPTVADMVARFEKEHFPRCRAATARDYALYIRKDILPALKHRKVAEVTYDDINALHQKITTRDAPYMANRVLAVLSKMFSLSVQWRWRTDNPARGIQRNPEEKRERYLSIAEIERLSAALAEHEDRDAANIIRLLLFTGARRGEVQSATWDQFDLENGVWTKPSAHTKQKKVHRVPLSAPARQLLVDIRERVEKAAKQKGKDTPKHVFPGRAGKPHRVEIKDAWAALCKAAKIENARIHDVRHTFASVLVSSGLSLPIIGGLLGHTQPATTARYAHLADEPQRAAAERVGAIVAGKPSAEVVSIERARR